MRLPPTVAQQESDACQQGREQGKGDDDEQDADVVAGEGTTALLDLLTAVSLAHLALPFDIADGVGKECVATDIGRDGVRKTQSRSQLSQLVVVPALGEQLALAGERATIPIIGRVGLLELAADVAPQAVVGAEDGTIGLARLVQMEVVARSRAILMLIEGNLRQLQPDGVLRKGRGFRIGLHPFEQRLCLCVFLPVEEAQSRVIVGKGNGSRVAYALGATPAGCQRSQRLTVHASTQIVYTEVLVAEDVVAVERVGEEGLGREVGFDGRGIVVPVAINAAQRVPGEGGMEVLAARGAVVVGSDADE